MSRLKAGWVVMAAVLAAAAIAVPVAIGQNGNGDGNDEESGEADAPDVTRSFEVPEDMQKFQECMSEQGIEPPEPPVPGSPPQAGDVPEPPEGIEEAFEACAEFAPEGGPGPMGAPGGPPPGGMPGLPCPDEKRGSNGNSDASAATSAGSASA